MVTEPGSFDDAFDTLFPQAARLAYKVLGHRAAAEDVAAEALARALANWARVSTLPYRDAWVLRVAVNLAVDTARRKKPELQAKAPLDAAEAATLRVALAGALGSLPRRQREAIGLRYLTGMTDGEVAKTLGIAEGTVRTHVRRGLHALRLSLGDDVSAEEALGVV
jgi:RNA polymerase sigma factor (sigma-70 family)